MVSISTETFKSLTFTCENIRDTDCTTDLSSTGNSLSSWLFFGHTSMETYEEKVKIFYTIGLIRLTEDAGDMCNWNDGDAVKHSSLISSVSF